MSKAGPEIDALASTYGLPEEAIEALAAALRTPADDDRYEDLGLLGRGGMGEVRRVRDRKLERVLAMKVIRPEAATHPNAQSRFADEARVTARLQHPGIVAVHDFGTHPDGRMWFTMREVRGSTLGHVLRGVHEASDAGAWVESVDGYTFRRLVVAFVRACEAVAYAHSAGVVHRDLKPANIMLGGFGEVQVMDWGLALFKEAATGESGNTRLLPRHDATRDDGIVGTPAYMAPEQARGEHHRVDPTTDVWALGCVLFEILTGRPPFSSDVGDTFDDVRQGRARSASSVVDDHHPPLPDALVDIQVRAMRPHQRDRYDSAEALAAAVRAWLEGAERRDRAMALVHEAVGHAPHAAALRAQAAAERDRAARLLEAVPPWAPAAARRPAWLVEDAATLLDREARQAEVAYLQALRAALRLDPELPEARSLLADHYRARLEHAETHGDPDAAAELEAQLRATDTGRHRAWLAGHGALTLVTEPPAAATLYRFVDHDRRLVPVVDRELGSTPLLGVEIPRGTYTVRLQAPGRPDVWYPVHVGRTEHWHGRRPGSTEPTPIELPEHVPDGACYVAPGWFECGGDPDAPDGLPAQRGWVDGFFIDRHPVRWRDYVAFLNARIDAGLPVDDVIPRDEASGECVLRTSPSGHFRCESTLASLDCDGALPAVLITWTACAAYAAWRVPDGSARLPTFLEWEKAARGVDGRPFPWGYVFDPSWANTLTSHEGAPRPTPVEEFPGDVSVYGVRGTAGNVREWCHDTFSRGGPLAGDDASSELHYVRGGAYVTGGRMSRLAGRFAIAPHQARRAVGFRLVQPLRRG